MAWTQSQCCLKRKKGKENNKHNRVDKLTNHKINTI